jgi:hypothetical protein
LQTFCIAPGHEVARANRVVWRVEQEAIRADGVIPVMLNDRWCSN